ncbi:hypothetical protein [Actinocorallia longicatena]|uniref:Winged helix DNA-binding protein n=1 Tax=Actinocorallia longicatena TaxID=111803 RepID=A0ABP6Q839_9ACTN
MTDTTPAFGTALIGRTEKTLNAILERLLDGTGITEPQWVTLTLAVTGGPSPRAEFVARAAAVTRSTEEAVGERVAGLAGAGILAVGPDGVVQVTGEGRERWDAVRASIGEITGKLWGDLPAEDLAVAGRVLGTVLARADAVLAAR